MSLKDIILVGATLSLAGAAVAGDSQFSDNDYQDWTVVPQRKVVLQDKPVRPGFPSVFRAATAVRDDQYGSFSIESVRAARIAAKGYESSEPVEGYEGPLNGPRLLAPGVDAKPLSKGPVRIDAYPIPHREPVKR